MGKIEKIEISLIKQIRKRGMTISHTSTNKNNI